jgi:hypothetical protein
MAENIDQLMRALQSPERLQTYLIQKSINEQNKGLNLSNMMTLLNNRDVPFVDRVLNPQDYPTPSIFDKENRMQTHFMMASPDKEGNWFVFPSVVFEDGKYKKIENEDEAFKYAKKNKNIVSFGKNKQAAINFSANYKPEEFKTYYKGLLAVE